MSHRIDTREHIRTILMSIKYTRKSKLPAIASSAVYVEQSPSLQYQMSPCFGGCLVKVAAACQLLQVVRMTLLWLVVHTLLSGSAVWAWAVLYN